MHLNKFALWAPLAIAPWLSGQTVDQLTPHQVKLERVEYKGKRAIKIVEEGRTPNGEAYAMVRGANFHNGEIEVELAGQPAGGASGGARGFIGMAFRMKDGQFEYIYLRPTNGRADDQVRRNHSVQYSAHPNFSYEVSRARLSPEKYESYVDLEVGRVDALPTDGGRHEGAAVRTWRGAALSDRE